MRPLANTSELLIRNLAAMTPGRLLLVNPPGDELASELILAPGIDQITLFTQDYSDHLIHRRYDHQLVNAEFGPRLESDQHFDQVIVFLARERQRTQMLLEMVSHVAGKDANVWMVGEKRAGIKTSSRFLADTGGAVRKLDAARHCMLFSAPNGAAEGTFSLDSWFENVQVKIGSQSLPMVSLPGVFSHGKLDRGTRVLLENLEPPNQGRVLDFGCGCGIVGTWLKMQKPGLELVLADNNALALAASQETIRRNELGAGARIIATDVFSEIEGRFDLIVSNPPFHRGVATHYSATESFLQQSVRHLHRNGRLVIVANRFIRYRPLLERVFSRVETLSESAGFRVYRCRQH